MALEDMPVIPSDAGNNLWKGVGQGIDNFINGLIERVGELTGAAVTAVAEKSVDVAASVSGAAMSAGTAPFKDFVPSMTPGGRDAEAPNTPSRSQEIAVDASRETLGVMSPPSTPSAGISVGQSYNR